MNLYLEPKGFLGTGASLLADLTLIGYLFLIIPGMIAGFTFARQGKHRPQHQVVMNSITIVNWVLIALLMLAAFQFDIVENIARQPGNLRYLLPTIHGIFGLSAQVLATFILVRMALEDRAVAAAKRRRERNLRPYWWKHAKPIMQVTLALWLATAVMGIGSYLIRYNVISGVTPGAVGLPAATEEPESTADTVPEAVNTPEAVDTQTAAPAVLGEPEIHGTEESGVSTTATPTPARRATLEPAKTAEAADRQAAPAVLGEPEIHGTEESGASATATPTPTRRAALEPAKTPEVASTLDAAVDDSGRGRGRGRGRGGG